MTNTPHVHHLCIEGHTLQALEFNATGQFPSIIFIHGITASNVMWSIGQTPHVKAHHRWYALSLPGHFPATFPDDHRPYEINAAAHARIMGEAIRRLVGDEPVILAGHSTGGFAALNIAANASDMVNVAGIVSISGFAHGRWMGPLGLLQSLARGGMIGHALFHLFVRLLGMDIRLFKLAIAAYGHDRRAMFAHPDAGPTFDAMFPYIRQIDAGAMRQYFYRMPHINIHADLCRINAPTLVMAGSHDPIVPPEQSRLIAERIPCAELVMMHGVGHLPMSERGADYNRLITDWLIRHFA